MPIESAPYDAPLPAGSSDCGPVLDRGSAFGWAWGPVLLWLSPALAIVIVAIVGPIVAPNPVGQSVAAPFAPPGSPLAQGTLLGTDKLGRDVLSQVLHGGRTMVLFPVAAALLATLVGAALGLLLGWFDNVVSRAATRLSELLLAVPPVIILLTVLHSAGRGPLPLALMIVVMGAPFTTRVVATAARPLRSAGYVEAALAMGDPVRRVLAREVLPVLGPVVLTDLGLRIVASVYVIAAASVLGFGAPPPATDWATQMQQNLDGAGLNPWGSLLPALLVAVFAICANLGLDRLAMRFGAGTGAER